MSRKADKERIRRRGVGFPRFFTKQILTFALLAFFVMVLDLVLYACIAVYESDASFSNGTPTSVVRSVRDGFARDEAGALMLSPEAASELDEHGAWALVVSDDGAVVWEYQVPSDIPRAYTSSEVAMVAHYASNADYPVFLWAGDEGLLMVGYPKNSFWHFSVSYPIRTVANLPLYIMLVLGVDLLVLFVYVLWSRHKVTRAVEPITGAIDDLAHNRPVQLKLKGDLRGVGESVTLASDVMQKKDKAREQWIRGVSHDIRTPLALIVGQAEGIAGGVSSEVVREKALAIRSQAFRIKDLVVDLNTASQLEYDAQPVHEESVALARLLRTVLADQMNALAGEEVSNADEGRGDTRGVGAEARVGERGSEPPSSADRLAFSVELDVHPEADDTVVRGDPRLLQRAVANLLANARLHNAGGCTVVVGLRREGSQVVLTVTDDGTGASPEDMAKLEARLARARVEGGALPNADGHGLGLVLVDRIMRAHGGSLSVESVEGAGFTVRLRLPLQ